MGRVGCGASTSGEHGGHHGGEGRYGDEVEQALPEFPFHFAAPCIADWGTGYAIIDRVLGAAQGKYGIYRIGTDRGF
jgi:hypothetical protein